MLLVYVQRSAKNVDPIMWLRATAGGLVYETSPRLERFLGGSVATAKEWCDRRFHRQWLGRDKYPWLRNPAQSLPYEHPVAVPYETPAQFRASNLNPWPERRKDYYYGP